MTEKYAGLYEKYTSGGGQVIGVGMDVMEALKYKARPSSGGGFEFQSLEDFASQAERAANAEQGGVIDKIGKPFEAEVKKKWPDLEPGEREKAYKGLQEDAKTLSRLASGATTDIPAHLKSFVLPKTDDMVRKLIVDYLAQNDGKIITWGVDASSNHSHILAPTNEVAEHMASLLKRMDHKNAHDELYVAPDLVTWDEPSPSKPFPSAVHHRKLFYDATGPEEHELHRRKEKSSREHWIITPERDLENETYSRPERRFKHRWVLSGGSERDGGRNAWFLPQVQEWNDDKNWYEYKIGTKTGRLGSA